MPLILRAVSLNDLPLTQPITALFDAQGGTIGRADHNTLALPDPERHISRQQAEIRAGASGFLICNVGSANPITVRGQPLPQGQTMPLAHRDEVRIGGYLLEVIDNAAGAAEGATVVQRAPETPTRPAVAAARPAAVIDPFADPLSDPFAILSRPSTAAPPPSVSAPPAPAFARLPDDFDPFAPPPPPPALPPALPPAASMAPPAAVDAFADLMPSENRSSLDDLFGLPQTGAQDPLADFMAGAATTRGTPSDGLSTDPLALFDAAPSTVPRASATLAPEAAALHDHTPVLASAFNPPPLRQPAPPPPPRPEPAPIAAPRAMAAAGDAALWAAFCEGAGIRPDPAQQGGTTPEQMRLVGELLRTAVDGALQMMAVRAATKHELRAQVTMIRARDNNPLKFSPDAQSALEQLLQPPVRGFLPGAAAMNDAMQDLVGHTIGTMAGTRAALEGVLGRFRPEVLEAKLAGRSMLDSVLPLNRKAKLWDLYLQHYEAIREEAQEEFHTLFGKAFLEAYEEQLERLRQRKSAAA
ncbi:type VI secretion system-associated FHA domain protein TagH [Roseateles sp. DAIF2]|uniref:type VI secretion system-associated FHA domain protein TagH n=1 Tax=Roseateles sp. DAIF2 TaxID=2714952 RepID=UPI0018A3330E|nr:type VI secretion system-associated FHA domain protein TagH [Roseateles sp. DAIF2]QPF75649.1 type VI secretion system-associated FHA domain protein TagH [Roseateles sp. DAIF2]